MTTNTESINDRLGPGGLETVAVFNLDTSGNTTGFVHPSTDLTIPFSGSDVVLTVGAKGMYQTIQAAVDAASTMTFYSAITAPTGLPTTATSWANGSSSIVVDPFSSSNKYRDFHYIQVDGGMLYKLESMDAANGFLEVANNRTEASIPASSAITYYQDVLTVTIVLLEDRTDAVTINTNGMNLNFYGHGVTWSGVTRLVMGSSFLYGRISFSGNLTIYATTGTFQTIGRPANNVQLRLNPGVIIKTRSADCFSGTGAKWGSCIARGITLDQQPTTGSAHVLNPECTGDFILSEITWLLSGYRQDGITTPASYMNDQIICRNYSLNGCKVIINDPLQTLSEVVMARMTTSLNPNTAGSVSISGVTVVTQTPLICNFTAFNDGWVQAVSRRVKLSGIKINLPECTGTIKIYAAVAGSINTVYAEDCSGGSLDKPSAGTLTMGSQGLGIAATNGVQTATLTNLPAAATAGNPNQWKKITLDDGTTGYIPVWK